MTTNDKMARRKLSLLKLTNEMSNISKACRITVTRPYHAPAERNRSMSYFRERKQGEQPREFEAIGEGAWGGSQALIMSRVSPEHFRT